MKDVYERRKAWVVSGMKKPAFVLIIFCMALVGSYPALAQEVTVTGKVTAGDTGDDLPGVTVVQKGTTKGTVTDISGNYSIKVDEDAVLVYSFLGYKSKEISISGRSTIDVSMDINAEELEEVVVVGYGEMRKADLTSAQTSISSEDIGKTINTTIDQAIAGRSAGVYVTQNTGAPGGGISVNIRGLNTIGGSNEPLYVIDGVQVTVDNSAAGTNPLSSLNPSDVASIEILQGPSAIAIYGSRGTNGVVMITTKRGKVGEVKISYGYTYSLQTAPQKLEVLDMRQYAQMENEYKNIVGGDVREDFLDPTLLGDGTDWQHELFKAAAMQKHQLSLSGGGEKTTYYLSGEHFDQEGVALGSGFKRNSLRLNIDNKPREWFKVGANINISQTDEEISSTQSQLITDAIRLAPYIPVKNIDGTYGGGNIQNSSAEQFAPPNPIGLAEIITNERMQRRLLGGLNAGFKIVDGLEFRTSFNTDIGFSSSTYYLPTYKFGYQENNEAQLDKTQNFSSYWNWNQTLQYIKEFGNHRLDVMVTHEAQESQWERLFAQRKGFSTNEVLDLNAGDPETASNGGGQGDWAMESYLGRLNYNFGDRYIITAAFRADGSSNFAKENKWGYFPSVSAAWRLSEENFFNVGFISDLRFRYEIGLTGNQGGSGPIYARMSQALPTDLGTAFYPANYPNPDYQWEQTQTDNYGITLGLFDSRIQIDADYYIKSTDNLILQTELPWYMGTDGNAAVTAPTVNIGSLGNKGWGASLNTINVDNGSFKWTTNINVSQFKTEITSLASGAEHITREGESWFLNNFAQRSVVGMAPWQFFGFEEEGIFESIEEIEDSALPVDNEGNEYPVGENSIWVGDVKYKDQITEDTDGDGILDSGDGIIDEKDMTFIGNPWPKLYGGITNTFSYKGFELSILLQGSYGNEIYNYMRYENANPNNINLGRNMFLEAFDYAKVGTDETGNPYLENPGTTVSRMSTATNNGNYDRLTDKYVEDGSYLRVKNVSLSYRLPSSILDRQNVVRGVTITASAQNVYTFTNYSGYDPEVGSYVGPNAQVAGGFVGVDYGRYPLTPVYSFSVGIDF
ncbi:SusC/RagA family TonB-linked outer membrane protein [Reichenbachiella ulvae]|uniref:TonB-dependent receptor n=1 Tax=Reichenbachiella ulvae TaxID=2980104 RepID=A0ABT3CUU9_9BACT|nr:TonB-dependent receptor [Reichenbachiella ulvae]MCV9387013.1 TonB-dependent receptor [Reichenbachiella ulvae]